MGLNWRPAGGWEVGAQVARAHRTPSVEELFADGPHLGAGAYEIGAPDLADEIGHGVDLFIRRGWGNGGLEVAAFHNRIRGFVAFQPQGWTDPDSGLPVFAYEGTDARLLGGELMGEWRPTDRLEVGLGLDWVRGDRVGGGTTPLPSIPPFRARFSLRWEADRTGRYLLDGTVGAHLDPTGRHSALLRVENATNRLYRDHLSRVEERGFPMPGRNLSVVYRWSF